MPIRGHFPRSRCRKTCICEMGNAVFLARSWPLKDLLGFLAAMNSNWKPLILAAVVLVSACTGVWCSTRGDTKGSFSKESQAGSGESPDSINWDVGLPNLSLSERDSVMRSCRQIMHLFRGVCDWSSYPLKIGSGGPLRSPKE